MNKILLEEDHLNGKLRFNLLNGSFTLNLRDYGAYAIATGCGSGKTTIIKQLIGIKWHEGVLYSAFTISEVNEMYEWIVNNLVGRSNPNTNQVLKLEDIIVLHSESNEDDLNIWRNNPDEIQNKKIILCTHYKLVNEPTMLFLGSKFVSSSIFSPKYRALCGIGEFAPRQWILIDEGLDASSVKCKIPKYALAPFSKVVTSVNRVIPDETTRAPKCVSIECEPYIDRTINSYSEFCKLVKTYMKMYRIKSFLNPETSYINKVRNEHILGEIYDNFSSYSEIDSDYIPISYGIHSLSLSEMKTRVFLFDGTSDITLSTSSKFKVISYSNKYNSPVNIQKIPFGLDRNVNKNATKGQTETLDELIKRKLDETTDRLVNIIRENKKTLIFTWKDFKMDSDGANDDIDDNADENNIININIQSVINPNFRMTEYIRVKLMEKGINPDQFAVEYYGSGKDKAVNEYREFDGVVLLGKYQVPGHVINEFNIDNHSSITGTEYYANRVVQAVCRTRIRMHQGLPINVYFSSDWNDDVISLAGVHLGVKGLVCPKLFISNLESDIKFMTSVLRTDLKISPKKAEQIAKLSTLDRGIYCAIVNNGIYKCTLSLDDVYSIIPMSRKEVDAYKWMKGWITKYGIDLTIKK